MEKDFGDWGWMEGGGKETPLSFGKQTLNEVLYNSRICVTWETGQECGGGGRASSLTWSCSHLYWFKKVQIGEYHNLRWNYFHSLRTLLAGRFTSISQQTDTAITGVPCMISTLIIQTQGWGLEGQIEQTSPFYFVINCIFYQYV